MNMILVLAFSVVASQSDKPKQQDCPMHAAHGEMKQRGEKGMGFSQTSTTHHFLLNSNGGANDAVDAQSRDNIRMHLGHIAKAFQSGDFDIPMFVHDTVPPGVPEMKRLQNEIHYVFGETLNGGRVVISTTNKEAIDAIHRFLRFQIEEHKTGDPVEVH